MGKVLPLTTPFIVMADISDVCNFQCGYCFRGMDMKEEHYGKNNLIPWKVFQKIVDQTLEFEGRVKRFSLSHNGESLAHPRFAEFVKYVKEKNVADSVEIHTNGSLLNEKLVDEIAESGIDRIIIFLQGLTDEIYQAVCKLQRTSMERVIRGSRYVR